MSIQNDFDRIHRWAFGMKDASPEYRNAVQRFLESTRRSYRNGGHRAVARTEQQQRMLVDAYREHKARGLNEDDAAYEAVDETGILPSKDAKEIEKLATEHAKLIEKLPPNEARRASTGVSYSVRYSRQLEADETELVKFKRRCREMCKADEKRIYG